LHCDIWLPTGLGSRSGRGPMGERMSYSVHSKRNEQEGVETSRDLLSWDYEGGQDVQSVFASIGICENNKDIGELGLWKADLNGGRGRGYAGLKQQTHCDSVECCGSPKSRSTLRTVRRNQFAVKAVVGSRVQREKVGSWTMLGSWAYLRRRRALFASLYCLSLCHLFQLRVIRTPNVPRDMSPLILCSVAPASTAPPHFAIGVRSQSDRGSLYSAPHFPPLYTHVPAIFMLSYSRHVSHPMMYLGYMTPTSE
jgi:hypothetical protein